MIKYTRLYKKAIGDDDDDDDDGDDEDDDDDVKTIQILEIQSFDPL